MTHTPGPWEIKEGAGGSQEIHAKVNIGRDMSKGVLQPLYDVQLRPSLMVGEDGAVYASLTYDSYRQFPSVDFVAMQRANARLIAAAPDLKDELQDATNLICHLCVRLNPQHLDAFEKGECSCVDTDGHRAAIAKATETNDGE